MLNIKIKDISYTSKSFPNTHKSSTENASKSYKNRLTHRVANCFYYEKQLQKLKSNAKATWRVLKEVLNRNKGKCGLPSIFRALNRDISNPGEIANLFCKYFTDIGPN